MRLETSYCTGKSGVLNGCEVEEAGAAEVGCGGLWPDEAARGEVVVEVKRCGEVEAVGTQDNDQ
ncbi:hypothetical protein DOTSEDRAFT_72316 [Dothistroma septosporum NZE10]|uniref:Uncharacterized protein n=1 Tax=Dothistroma septosporum (strain NZE10 / CBS 128990) TaxID=675120 RepID=M2WLC0_DOTSN|nr:hypothetical protein DOTSEDRAFT_72316 [Dothistroma septosporum NZE10]